MYSDEYFMKIVYNLARESAKNYGNAFSAILVLNDEIVHKSFDISMKTFNPTLHAELNVLSEYCSKNKILSLDGYTLYCNVEPCVMCSGAIHWSRVSRVVYGMSQKSLNKMSNGKLKPKCEELINIGHKKIEIVGPIMEDEGIKLFTEYPIKNIN